MEMSKRDALFRDAIETAAESHDPEVAEALLRYLIDIKQYECFTAALYACYDLLKPDVVLELAWRNKLMDFAMPFMIQVLREYMGKVDVLEKANEERTKREEEDEKKHQSLNGSLLFQFVRARNISIPGASY